LYRRLRRGKEQRHTHEELLEIINDIWEIQSEGKKCLLYQKGEANSGDTAKEFDCDET
jgi:hypothetical protein